MSSSSSLTNYFPDKEVAYKNPMESENGMSSLKDHITGEKHCEIYEEKSANCLHLRLMFAFISKIKGINSSNWLHLFLQSHSQTIFMLSSRFSKQGRKMLPSSTSKHLA